MHQHEQAYILTTQAPEWTLSATNQQSMLRIQSVLLHAREQAGTFPAIPNLFPWKKRLNSQLTDQTLHQEINLEYFWVSGNPTGPSNVKTK